MTKLLFLTSPDGFDEHGRQMAITFEKRTGCADNSAEMCLWTCIARQEGEFPSDNSNLSTEISFCFECPGVAEAGAVITQVSDNSIARTRTLASIRWEKAKQTKATQQTVGQIMRESKKARRIQETMYRSTSTQTESCVDVSHELALAVNQTQFGPPRFQDLVLENCCRNSHKERPSYNKEIYDMSMLCYLTSAKGYRILTQLLPLPSIASLYRNYQERLHEFTRRLTDLTMVHESVSEIVEEIRSLRPDTLDNFPFTLAIDAFSFQSFVSRSSGSERDREDGGATELDKTLESDETIRVSVTASQVQFRYGFVFMLISHDQRIRPRVVHLAPATKGAFTTEIEKKAKAIRELSNSKGLRVWLQATDGDPGVSAHHERVYSEHIKVKDRCFMQLVTTVYSWLCKDANHYIPTSDPLHVLKNIRAKLIAHPIKLYPGSKATDINELRNTLSLGAVLNDESQIGKMRDGYVTKLFTFENVIKLLARGSYVNGFLLLPFACWTSVLFCSKLTLNLRLFLVELAYRIVCHWADQFPALHAVGVGYRCSPGHSAITFNDKHYSKRILNTLVAFGVCLSFGTGYLRLDSLGTHLVENSIGIARVASHGDPRYERVKCAYTHAELRKELAVQTGVKLHVPGRINDGGCKLDPTLELTENEGVLSKPSNWRVDRILTLMHASCLTETAPAMKDDVDAFAAELSTLASSLDVRHYKIGDTANSCIMARLIASGSAKCQEVGQ